MRLVALYPAMEHTLSHVHKQKNVVSNNNSLPNDAHRTVFVFKQPILNNQSTDLRAVGVHTLHTTKQ